MWWWWQYIIVPPLDYNQVWIFCFVIHSCLAINIRQVRPPNHHAVMLVSVKSKISRSSCCVQTKIFFLLKMIKNTAVIIDN